MNNEIKKDKSTWWAIILFFAVAIFGLCILILPNCCNSDKKVNVETKQTTYIPVQNKQKMEILNNFNKFECKTEITVKTNNESYAQLEQNKEVFSYIGIIGFISVLLTVIICLTVIIIKNDNGLRFEKLNIVNSLKNSDDIFKFVEYGIQEIEKKEKMSEGSENKPANETTYTKKNLRAELAKKYMDAIVEI